MCGHALLRLRQCRLKHSTPAWCSTFSCRLCLETVLETWWFPVWSGNISPQPNVPQPTGECGMQASLLIEQLQNRRRPFGPLFLCWQKEVALPKGTFPHQVHNPSTICSSSADPSSPCAPVPKASISLKEGVSGRNSPGASFIVHSSITNTTQSMESHTESGEMHAPLVKP